MQVAAGRVGCWQVSSGGIIILIPIITEMVKSGSGQPWYSVVMGTNPAVFLGLGLLPWLKVVLPFLGKICSFHWVDLPWQG